MKFLASVLVLAVIALCNAEWKIQTQENLAAYRPECATSLQIPEDKVNEYKKFNFPDDEKTQLGQGKNETEIKPEIEKCADKNTQKSNACQWAYRGFDCFKKAHLELVQASVKKN